MLICRVVSSLQHNHHASAISFQQSAFGSRLARELSIPSVSSLTNRIRNLTRSPCVSIVSIAASPSASQVKGSIKPRQAPTISSSLEKRAIKVLYPQCSSEQRPQFVVGLSIYQGVLGYAILNWSDQSTIKLGLLDLYNKTTKKALDFSKISLLIKEAFAEVKGTTEARFASRINQRASEGCEEHDAATRSLWTIGLTDGLAFKSPSNKQAVDMERFALEQKLYGILMIDLGSLFGITVSSVSTAQARRSLGNELKMKIDTVETCLEAVASEVSSFPVVKTPDGKVSSVTYAMAEAWLIAHAHHVHLQADLLFRDPVTIRLINEQAEATTRVTHLQTALQGHRQAMTDDVDDIRMSLVSQSNLAKQHLLYKLVSRVHRLKTEDQQKPKNKHEHKQN